MPGVPWRLWKAQLYQESRLDPDARSGVGAEGLAQFMPATWAEVSKAMKWGIVDRRAVGPAIEGGAYYMSALRKAWDPADFERHRFAAASYNAGRGNVSRARRSCEGAGTWALVAPCLVEITGPANAAQTTGYVASIWKWFAAMEIIR